jgi:hypothetical protein
MPTAPRSCLRIVDRNDPVERTARYLARIRWSCDVDPDWEIDTRHSGFETWRAAACFANGLAEEGASILFLQEGALILQLVNGRDVLVRNEEIVVWHRASLSEESTDDATFVRAPAGPRDLSAMGLDGVLSPTRFGVDDGRGSRRLDVRVEADVRRRAVMVSLEVPGDDDEAEMSLFQRQLLQPPQA